MDEDSKEFGDRAAEADAVAELMNGKRLTDHQRDHVLRYLLRDTESLRARVRLLGASE